MNLVVICRWRFTFFPLLLNVASSGNKVCCSNMKWPRCMSTLTGCLGHLAVSHRVLLRPVRVVNLKDSCIVHCIQCSRSQRNISWSLCAWWGTCSSTPGTKFTKPKGTQIVFLCDLIQLYYKNSEGRCFIGSLTISVTQHLSDLK